MAVRSRTARVLDEDDPRAPLRRMGLQLNALVVRLTGTDLLSVRVYPESLDAGSSEVGLGQPNASHVEAP